MPSAEAGQPSAHPEGAVLDPVILARGVQDRAILADTLTIFDGR